MTTAASPRSTRLLSSSLSVRTHCGGVEIVDQLASEWRDLCSESADDQIFYRPEFIRAHIRAKIPAARLVILTVRQEERLRFLLPLIEERSTFSKIPVRRLREPADLNCGRFDAVRSAGAQGEAAILAAWRHLRKMGGWDLLQLRFSLTGSTTGRLASAAEADGFLRSSLILKRQNTK